MTSMDIKKQLPYWIKNTNLQFVKSYKCKSGKSKLVKIEITEKNQMIADVYWDLKEKNTKNQGLMLCEKIPKKRKMEIGILKVGIYDF
ncbi:hypothetical protein [Bacillus cereus]|uniref:hypothetical protein n=1 Tax=Bacillus cereus TaxID=1396 RepID=UPI000BEBD4AA|nr:hypothetical protein [Bacillus cereus]MEC3021110.1 hypothetical protein [Bacillus cereus]MEC3256355.1 hypothetical protein [Bacillus cereus]PDY68978.1 hypothetical protein COM88_10195 [Bacillus cereus]PGQ87858.1 hypothetical protein COA26_08040 [Bacillus cereus]